MNFRFAITVAVVCAMSHFCLAFSSEKWLAVRNDDSDMLRLKKAYAECLKKDVAPANDVVIPIESYSNGTVKSRLRAKQVKVFFDTSYIWADGVQIEQFDENGRLTSYIDAQNCILDRNSKTAWIDGNAKISYNGTRLSGRGVYVDANREFVKIFSNTEIKGKNLKFKSGDLLK